MRTLPDFVTAREYASERDEQCAWSLHEDPLEEPDAAFLEQALLGRMQSVINHPTRLVRLVNLTPVGVGPEYWNDETRIDDARAACDQYMATTSDVLIRR